MHNFLLHCAAATAQRQHQKTEMHAVCANSTYLCCVLGCVLHFTWDGCILLHMFCVHVLFFITYHLMENNSVSLWGFFTHWPHYNVATPLNVWKDNLIYSLMSQIHFSGWKSLSRIQLTKYAQFMCSLSRCLFLVTRFHAHILSKC